MQLGAESTDTTDPIQAFLVRDRWHWTLSRRAKFVTLALTLALVVQTVMAVWAAWAVSQNAPVVAVIATTVTFGILAMFAVRYVTDWMTNAVTLPLRELTQAALRMREGDTAYRVDLPDADENLSVLASTFNVMAARLDADRQRLERLARFDELTGLINRREVMGKLEDSLARTRRYTHPTTVILLDIDHFKRVNDTYGHPAGDAVLQQVADRLQQCVRPTDAVGRYGGEEFAVVLPETMQDNGVVAAERLRLTVCSTNARLPDGTEIEVTISLGVATAHGENADLEDVLHRADQALYVAKEAGRNQVASDTSQQSMT